MKKETAKRIFTFPDAKLVGIAELLTEFIIRDQGEFSAYGYAENTLPDFQVLINTFRSKPTNSNIEKLQVEATQRKDAKASELKSAIRQIMSRVRLAYGEDSPRYKRFGTKGMDAMTDDQLRTCGEQVEDVAGEYLADLAVRGVTAEMIAAVLTATESFATALKAQRKTISDRSILTTERIEAANALYARTLELANAGKAIWYERNEAKYRDYVIYDEKGSPVEKTELVKA